MSWLSHESSELHSDFWMGRSELHARWIRERHGFRLEFLDTEYNKFELHNGSHFEHGFHINNDGCDIASTDVA